MNHSMNPSINQSHWQVVHFTDQSCAVCDVVGMKLIEIINEMPTVDYVALEASANPEQASRFQIHQFPTVLIIYEGKVYKRYERVFSIDQLAMDLERYVALSM